ncbi:cysteine proteinase [Trametes versicolor FP-101664 SS1]|uniref:cysteine proteinase n=1 Tax=Trametes versicolor (strain FP-101664) TaxID=717944 RepID=UPI00046215AE|nr:cysteine proteinase [Trametes versicolor FP-101664 SS1]EIW60454.1 cysteine proteinase [Trametes versicolor FP-101664 SS1]
MGAKKNKLKRMLSPTTPPPPEATADDDELMDDLFAQLDSKDGAVRHESATVLNEMQIDRVADQLESVPKKDGKARHKARQARKAAALAETYAPTDVEADARLERQAKDEEEQIKKTCDELGLLLHEINPDGHCLFSAVADQLALLGVLPASQATYATCRRAAADFIHAHPDDFLPFLPSEVGEDTAGATEAGFMTRAQFDRYCARMRDTAIWGGEPEVVALSRAYGVAIHVVQGGQPPVVVHDPADPAGQKTEAEGGKRTVYISYHRRLYGLGEHYNSLRPKTFANSLRSVFQ